MRIDRLAPVSVCRYLTLRQTFTAASVLHEQIIAPNLLNFEAEFLALSSPLLSPPLQHTPRLQLRPRRAEDVPLLIRPLSHRGELPGFSSLVMRARGVLIMSERYIVTGAG